MKELVFLPDREGRDDLGQANGFVRAGETLQSLCVSHKEIANQSQRR